MNPIRCSVILIGLLLTGCTSGGGQSCSFNGGTVLSPGPWPKFRADAANTGRSSVDLTGTTGENRSILFQARCNASTAVACTDVVDSTDCPLGQTCMPIGPVAAGPVLGPANIYVASTDQNLYVLNGQGVPVGGLPQITLPSAILGTPLIGADNSVFVPANNVLNQYFADSALRISAGINGFMSGSPNIWTDGTAVIGTQQGILAAVCPNGVRRFSVTFPATRSTAAVVQDPNSTDTTAIVVGAGANGQVRAYSIRGRQYWSFFAASEVIAAVLVDQSIPPPNTLFYVVDNTGHVYASTLTNGQPASPPFSFTAAGGVVASPALSRDATGVMPKLYVADETGVLWALSRSTGQVLWSYQVNGRITDSPAVATGGSEDVIVFAADILDPMSGQVVESRAYAIRDDGAAPTSLWQASDGDGVPTCGVVGSSSPAIGADGTVYFGLSSIVPGAPGCTDVVQTNGGALLAISG
jgi:outer membrane protein assembly factor BamB